MKNPLLLAALAVLATTATATATAQPAAPLRDVPETFFGTAVADPYRDLEDVKNPAVQAWMRAQDNHAQAALERIPGRAILLQRYQADDKALAARVTLAQREPGERWFYRRRGAGEDQFKLVTRQPLAGPERVLVDPKDGAINWAAPAPGGRSLAYGLSRQGSEEAVLHVVGTRSGRHLVAPVERADFGGLSWAPDGLRFVFNRLQRQAAGAPATEKFLNSQVLLMRLDPRPGQADRAPVVLSAGMPGVDIAPADVPVVSLTHDGRWALGYIYSGTQRELGLLVSPQAALLAGKPQWRRVVAAADQVFAATYFADQLYLLSDKGAPRGQLLALDLRNPQATPTVLQAQGPQVLTNLGAAADALYLEARDGNVKRLHRRAWAAGAAFAEVALPLAGSFTLGDTDGGVPATDPRLPGAVLELQGWTRARQIWQVHASGAATNTGLQPAGPRDAPPDLVATEVLVKSHDGAMVPMSVLHKKDLQFTGRHPTLLVGYGAYGSTIEPGFGLERLAWLDAGGVVALANPRGSGVYGSDWYRAGWQQSKPNTWKDMIACAEWLINNGWTAPQHLGIWGGSAGGVLAGRAITERPELFGAAVIQVGVLDALRAELTANGVPNIPEFGSRSTEPGFRALLEMSTYHQVKNGVKYPAVLLTHGVNDPRVDVWHSLKTAARLQAASASGKPVLLRLDWEAGHGVGSTKAQQQGLRADTYSFMGWQLGLQGFRPPGP